MLIFIVNGGFDSGNEGRDVVGSIFIREIGNQIRATAMECRGPFALRIYAFFDSVACLEEMNAASVTASAPEISFPVITKGRYSSRKEMVNAR